MLSGHREAFLTGAGAVLSGVLDVQPVIVLDSEVVGEDSRMKSTLRLLPAQLPPLKIGDVVTRVGDGAKFTLIHRENNAEAVTVDYEVSQNT